MQDRIALKYQKDIKRELKLTASQLAESYRINQSTVEYHKCMMNLNAWVEYFNMMNFKIKNIIPRDTWIKEVVPWECSEFFILEF